MLSALSEASAPAASAVQQRQRSGLLRGLTSLLAHLVVALVALVAIGGATRVMQAGLACPDWPLCFGTLLPGRQMNLQVFLEWFHRLDAFVVGVALLVVAGISVARHSLLPRWLPRLSFLALFLVAVQGGLGALTVVKLLASGTVTAHLLVALSLVLLISAASAALALATEAETTPNGTGFPSPPLWWPVLLAFSSLLLISQCVLGGAMASRWAASLCFEAGEGCRWLLAHRVGAWPAALGMLLPAAAAPALPAPRRRLGRLAAALALLAPFQVLLGVLSLRLQLSQPLVTVAHQILAAVLVALVGALWGRTLTSLPPSRSIPEPPSMEMVHG